MSEKFIGQVDVQYITLLYTREKLVLSADRRRNYDPKLNLLINDSELTILFEIENINAEPLRSAKSPKEGCDLYMHKPAVKSLCDYLDSIFPIITSKVTLNRALSGKKDPTANYAQQGLPIPIQSAEGRTKIELIKGDFLPQKISVSKSRKSEKDDEPSLNIEVENWDKPKMHVGIHFPWTETTNDAILQNKIIIVFSWAEYGHLVDQIKGVENQL